MSENETFDATRKLLLNIRSVRVFARETSFEQLLKCRKSLMP
jgi:DNA-binding protein StpA